MRVVVAVLLAGFLAGCTSVTIEHAGGAVVAKGSGLGFVGPKSVIDTTHEAAKYACEKKDVAALLPESENGLAPQVYGTLHEFLEDANAVAEEGKSLLVNLFGEHSYSVTRPCS